MNKHYVTAIAAGAIGLVVLAIALVLLGGSSEKQDATMPSTTQSAPQDEGTVWHEEGNPAAEYPSRVTASWLSDKADRAESRRISLDGVSFPAPPTGNTYAFVTVELQNKSTVPVNLGYNASATDDAGAVYEPTSDYDAYNSPTANPGATVKHTYMFLVPEGKMPATINFEVGTSAETTVEATARVS